MPHDTAISQTPVGHTPLPLLVLAAGLAAVLAWSSAFIGIGFALRAIPPAQLVLLRFLVASACFTVLAVVGRVRRPALRDLPGLVLLGLIGQVVYQLALVAAQTRISAGAAGVLIALVPALVALLAIPVLGERLPGWGWAGMALAFVGAALISMGSLGGGGIRFEPMALLGLGAAAASAAYFVFQKPWLARYGALDLTAYGVWTGAAVMLTLAGSGLPRTLATSTTSALLAAFYLGAVPTALGYALWAYALARGSAGRVTSLLYFEPLATFALAWLLLGEVPSTATLLGGAAALGGVVLVNMAGNGHR